MIRLGLTLALTVSLSAQQPPPPPPPQPPAPRDTSPVVPTRLGTGLVSGVVTLGDDARTPVRRAVVTLLSSDGLDPRSTISDDEGRFTIGGLPEGRYNLQALKGAHLTMAYGARRPGRAGTALVVGVGARLTDVHLTLPRGAVLGGRIMLDDGQPLANMQVMAVPTRLSTAGGSTLSTGQSFHTDDRGEFRIYGLMPDAYLVVALPVFGRGEIQRRTEGEYDTLVRTLQQPAPGSAAGRTSTPAPPPVVGYAPTYFPGTPIVTDALPIPVRAGEVRDDLHFTVSMVKMATLTGTLIGTTGRPEQAAMFSVETVGPPLPLSTALAPRVNRPNARGEFSVVGLAPGRYKIRARAGGVTLGDQGAISISGDAQTEWAVTEISVAGEDITGVSLTLRPGLTLRGTLAAAQGKKGPASWKGASVGVQPLIPGGGPTSSGPMLARGVTGRTAQVDEQGRFEITGIEPYDYELRVTLPAPLTAEGWTVRRVAHGDGDLRDAPLTFDQGSMDGVGITMTTTRTEFMGSLTSESGTPATDYFIVVFPTDRTLWHPASPRVRVLRPAADGFFLTRDLPPGSYRVAALTDVEDDEPRRADFLESIYESAITVTIAEGTATRQDIRIR